MDRTRLLSAALVALVVVWGAGSVSELFLTTLSVGPDVAPAAATLLALVALVLAAIAVGARGRRWLDNPEAYW
jgi:protein-S-isoprenylcysteine O-methyltransferase Ste14